MIKDKSLRNLSTDRDLTVGGSQKQDVRVSPFSTFPEKYYSKGERGLAVIRAVCDSIQ